MTTGTHTYRLASMLTRLCPVTLYISSSRTTPILFDQFRVERKKERNVSRTRSNYFFFFSFNRDGTAASRLLDQRCSCYEANYPSAVPHDGSIAGSPLSRLQSEKSPALFSLFCRSAAVPHDSCSASQLLYYDRGKGGTAEVDLFYQIGR